MTYAFSWPLQQALFAALRSAPEVAALAADRIYDEAPHAADGAPDGPYVLIGDEQVDPWSTATDAGATHAVQLSVLGAARGFATLKRLAGAVCEAALAAPPAPGWRIVNARFLGGRTRRLEGAGLRRIDLRLRFTIEGDPTGIEE